MKPQFEEMSMEEISELISEYMEVGSWHKIKDLRVMVERRKDGKNF